MIKLWKDRLVFRGAIFAKVDLQGEGRILFRSSFKAYMASSPYKCLHPESSYYENDIADQ